MKILHVLFSRGWGGLEQYAISQAAGMMERGHNVHFIRRQGTQTAKFLAARNFPGEEWSPMKYVDLPAMIRLRRAARRTGASIVHVHHSGDLGLVFPALLGARDIGLIFSTYMYIPAPKTDLYHRLEYGMVRRVLTLSDQMTENARANLPIAPERAMTMPYGLDLSRFDPAGIKKGALRDRFGIQPDRPIIGLVGRLDPFKGQVEMIQAMPAILDKFPDAILALVGGETPELAGVYHKKLEAEAARLGVEKSVIFAGYYENVALPMADMDVYVIPSHHETFGMSAIEAMAMGLPVVGSDAGGLPDVLDHGGCGLLARVKDPAAFADAVIRYLSDPGLRQSMGQKGREKALARHDKRRSMELLESVYMDLEKELGR